MGLAYLPRADRGALDWMTTFARGIAANPQRFALTPADGAALQQAVGTFADALTATANPGLRTPVALAAKKQARGATESLCRKYYSLIKMNMDIGDTDKIAIGVRPLNRSRTKRNAPTDSPSLNIVCATAGGQQLVRYLKSDIMAGHGKPHGAAFIELAMTLADQPSGDPAAAKSLGLYTTSKMNITHVHADNGKQATYFGRWVSRKGKAGPWSLPVSMTVAA